MILPQLGWRNIWRNPKRTILTVGAIGFSIMVLEFFFSLQLKTYDAAISASVGILHGHIQIQGEGYNDNPEIRNVITSANNLKAQIRELSSIEGLSMRGVGFGLVSSETRSYGVQILGVEPESEGEVSNIPGLIKDGVYLDNNQYLGAVIGSVLAKNLKIGTGQPLTLMSQGLDGSLVATVLTVIGIFESGSTEIDRSTVEISYRDFDELFEMNGGAHAIVVRSKDADTAQELLTPISQIILSQQREEKLAVLDWQKLLPGLKQSIDLDMSAGWLFYTSLIVIVSFSILNTFLMSVLERGHEFGVILSLGLKPKFMAGLLFLEALFLILIGILIGNLFGALIVEYFGSVGFSAPGAEEVLKKWNLPSRIFPEVSLKSFFWPSFTVGVSAIFSTLYPMFKVLRLDPLKALKGEV